MFATTNYEDFLLAQGKARVDLARARVEYADSPALIAEYEDRFAREMEKGVAGVTSDSLAAAIPQDLDPQYRKLDARAEDYGCNMLLRGLPKIQGHARTHQFALETRTGLGGVGGASSEMATGVFTPQTRVLRESTHKWYKLNYPLSYGASLVNSVDQDRGESRIRLNLRRLENQGLIWADTRTTLGGVDGIRQKGLLQLIEEQTNGSDAQMPSDGYNLYETLGHTWDAKGITITPDSTRSVPNELLQVWGATGNLFMFMPGKSISGLEATQDGSRRHLGAFDAHFQGQSVSGIMVSGNFMPYIPEMDLDPFSRYNNNGLYSDTRDVEGYPTSRPTVAITVQNEGTASEPVFGLFDANPYGADDVRYVATWVDANDLESKGTLTAAATVAANKQVKLVISGVPASATRVRVYRFNVQYGTKRGISTVLNTHACWVADVLPPGDGSDITWYDHNLRRPYCGTAIILRLTSQIMPYLTSKEAFERAVIEEKLQGIAPFVSENDSYDSAAREVYMGPSMFVMDLANVNHTMRHYVIGSWKSAQLTQPYLAGIMRNLPITF